MSTTGSPASASEMIAVSGSTTLLNLNMSNVTKLTASNFLMWGRQVRALLDGYDLVGYLDGSVTAPPPTITTEGVVTTNDAYVLWKRQDKLIFSALLGAISVSVQSLLSKANTTAEIWETLTSTYANPSRSHVQQLRQQLKLWKKGTKAIDVYFQGLTTKFDQLALLGKPLEHDEQIEFILEGLTDDYKKVVDQIEGRDKSPSLTEVYEKLLHQENKLAAQTESSPSLPVTANVANYRGNNNNNNARNHGRQNNRGSNGNETSA